MDYTEGDLKGDLKGDWKKQDITRSICAKKQMRTEIRVIADYCGHSRLRDSFNKLINEALADGFKPHGNLVVTGKPPVFFCAREMIKEVEE
jgi:hypothetical protein